METRDSIEARLALKPENGVYRLASAISKDELEQIVSEKGFDFYYINGKAVKDHQSFYMELREVFKFPEYAKGNWDAIFDVITEPHYYQANNKGIILFDECHNFANSDTTAYNTAILVFKDMPARFAHYLKHESMKGQEAFQVYVLLRGEDAAFEVLTEKNLPVPTF